MTAVGSPTGAAWAVVVSGRSPTNDTAAPIASSAAADDHRQVERLDRRLVDGRGLCLRGRAVVGGLSGGNCWRTASDVVSSPGTRSPSVA